MNQTSNIAPVYDISSGDFLFLRIKKFYGGASDLSLFTVLAYDLAADIGITESVEKY